MTGEPGGLTLWAMNSSRNKVYHVVSLAELKQLVAIAEAEADLNYGPDHPNRDNNCLILRGYVSLNDKHRAADGARQIKSLYHRSQMPGLFS